MNINTYLEADGPIKCFDVYFWLFLILFTHFRPSRTRIFRMFSRLKNGKKGAIMNINTYLEADVPIICFDVHFWLFLILFTHFRPSRTRIFRMFSRLKNGKKGAIMNINTYLEADVPIICFDVHFWLFLILFTHFRPSRTRIFRKSRVV